MTPIRWPSIIFSSFIGENHFLTRVGCPRRISMFWQCRRELGDNQGALRDLVKAFVLQGSALNGSGDGGEAQAIEDVSREASKTKAE